MNVAVIGADRPWGALLATGLGAGFEVVAIGSEDVREVVGYRQVDLLGRASLDPVLAGVEAVVYAAGSDPIGDSEQVLLDVAARGALCGVDVGLCCGC